MPKGTHAGASNAGEIEETHVVRADGDVQEVNVSTSQDAEPAPEPEPEKSEEVSSSPGSSSSPSQQTSEPTKPQKRTNR